MGSIFERFLGRWARGFVPPVALALSSAACSGALPPRPTAKAPLHDLRARTAANARGEDGDVVGRWALAEMFDPGGSADQAKKARDALGAGARPGVYENLARAVFDEGHGEPRSAADFYVATFKAASASRDPLAPLVAWYATRNALALRGTVTELFARHRGTIDALLAHPGHLGWRAVAELEDWRAAEVYDKAEATGDAYDREVVARMGCAKGIRIAGPFGHGMAADRRRSFPAEKPGPWPLAWPAHPSRGSPPQVLKVEQPRCLASAQKKTGDGVFYAETFFTTKREHDVILAVQGAVKVWVDDAPVVERDLRDWGVWQRFGAAVRVGAGRHRLLARVLSDGASIRILNLDGTPAGVETDDDATKPYSLSAPRVLPDPNPIDSIVRARAAPTNLEAMLSAEVAHAEGLDDVATVLIDPLVVPSDASAFALSAAATSVRGDPALPDDIRHRNEKDLRARAVAKDPRLWASRVWLILDDAEQRGPVEAVLPLRKLAEEFPNTPEVLEQLAVVYAKLGWHAERMQSLADLARRFPDAVGVLRMYLEALEEDGSLAEADKVSARIKKLDPDAELELTHAIAKHDWDRAIAELRKIEKRRPDRKEIAARIANVLARSGDRSAAAEQLKKALAKNPEDSSARFRLADLAYANGDTSALRRALAEARQSGGKTADFREAIDLLEGATNLEPYRIDGRAVIAEFERWEKTGKRMDGVAARVLDYSSIWVHPDGSNEMLEHEILKIQSQEAVTKEAEQQPPTGLVLRLRVIKPDGSTAEPEFVSGKPTLTMPHLEVGDYLEIEHITPQAGDGQKGKRFRGPHWFFREADKGYWRSEFITITPKDRDIEVETRGTVPPPKTRDFGTFTERTWRMDLTPPAPEEPDAPRPQEFLPSVRIGWGITLDELLERVVDALMDETPLDPRLHAKALEIVAGVPETKTDERAQRVYRWVLDSVEEGKESDGRRAIMGRSGSREAAFEHLMRQLRIPVEAAIVKNRLAMPPLGKMSEVENWDSVVLRLETDRGVRWLTVRDKFAPYAYVQAELRGQPAIRLVPGVPKDTTASQGAADGVMFEGRADVRDDGSASLELVQKFSGKVGISMRNVIDRVPDAQLQDFVETRLLSRNIPGARLRELKIENKGSLDQPLAVRMRAEVPQFLRMQGGQVAIKSFFAMHLAQLATLPERQTPLLLGSSSHLEVRFQVVLPDAIKMPASLPAGEVRDGERMVVVKDAVQGHAIELNRVVDIPAGRVQPGDEYARFLRFAQDADAFVEKEIIVGR